MRKIIGALWSGLVGSCERYIKNGRKRSAFHTVYLMHLLYFPGGICPSWITSVVEFIERPYGCSSLDPGNFSQWVEEEIIDTIEQPEINCQSLKGAWPVMAEMERRLSST